LLAQQRFERNNRNDNDPDDCNEQLEVVHDHCGASGSGCQISGRRVEVTPLTSNTGKAKLAWLLL
jgi:hypothetical protein